MSFQEKYLADKLEVLNLPNPLVFGSSSADGREGKGAVFSIEEKNEAGLVEVLGTVLLMKEEKGGNGTLLGSQGLDFFEAYE